MRAMLRTFLIAATALVSQAALAQSWPSKPIRIIVPFAAGGGSDFLSRLLSPKLTESLGQPVVVENQAGGGGLIGAERVARSAPDGYTILSTTPSTHVTGLFLFKKLPYDPVKDFTPITAAVEPATCLVINVNVPANSVKDYIEHVRRNPGKVFYGTGGIGSVFHMTGEMFNDQAGLKSAHVPYKGNAPLLTDLVGGQIASGFMSLSTALPFVQSGKVKLLAVLEASRYPKLPNVPTVGETLPGYEKPSSWWGFFAPANMPAPVLARIHGEIVKAIHAPDIRPKLEDNALILIGNTPEQFAAQIKTGFEVYGRLIKTMGLQPE
ncbi:MAG: Bug family tripartite tricarboxylate transporter substrate binding protein [Burkholderiales bacterium]